MLKCTEKIPPLGRKVLEFLCVRVHKQFVRSSKIFQVAFTHDKMYNIKYGVIVIICFALY